MKKPKSKLASNEAYNALSEFKYDIIIFAGSIAKLKKSALRSKSLKVVSPDLLDLEIALQNVVAKLADIKRK